MKTLNKEINDMSIEEAQKLIADTQADIDRIHNSIASGFTDQDDCFLSLRIQENVIFQCNHRIEAITNPAKPISHKNPFLTDSDTGEIVAGRILSKNGICFKVYPQFQAKFGVFVSNAKLDETYTKKGLTRIYVEQNHSDIVYPEKRVRKGMSGLLDCLYGSTL